MSLTVFHGIIHEWAPKKPAAVSHSLCTWQARGKAQALPFPQVGDVLGQSLSFKVFSVLALILSSEFTHI